MLSLLVSSLAAVYFLGALVQAQTPQGYTPNTTVPLYLKYPGYPTVKDGSVLPYNQPSTEPSFYASAPLNGTYLLFLVDADFNKSAPIPAKLLWIASGISFDSNPSLIAPSLAAYQATTSNSSKVPYLAPSIPGDTYIALIYESPPNFQFPPDFPYNATFRSGFNTTRIGVDFKTPLLEATYFGLRSNTSATAGHGPYQQPTGTAGYGGIGTPYPSGTASTGYGKPTGSGGYVTIPFEGKSGIGFGRLSLWMVGVGVIGAIVGPL